MRSAGARLLRPPAVIYRPRRVYVLNYPAYRRGYQHWRYDGPNYGGHPTPYAYGGGH